MVKGKVCIRAKLPVRPALISGFCSVNRLGSFLPSPPPVKWDASSSQNYPRALNSPVAIYTHQRVERGAVGVTCFAEERNLLGQSSNAGRSIWRRAH